MCIIIVNCNDCCDNTLFVNCLVRITIISIHNNTLIITELSKLTNPLTCTHTHTHTPYILSTQSTDPIVVHLYANI